MPRSILIIHPGAIGDLLLSLPAIRALRSTYPSYEIVLIAGHAVGTFLRACGEVHATYPIEGRALTGLLAGRVVTSPIRAWLERCDLAICWMTDPDQCLHKAFKEIGVPRIVIRSPADPSLLARHQTDRFLETIRPYVSMPSECSKIRPPKSIIEEMKAYLEGVLIASGQAFRSPVVVHPGSGSPHKCCNPALFAELITWCHSHGISPLILSGPADDRLVKEVLQRCSKRPEVLQQQDLLSVAGILSHARLFVGHDSGLTHLAAALDLPTVALFGPTDPMQWAPRGSRVAILTGEACRCSGWEAVRACSVKPCLQIPINRLVEACEHALNDQAWPMEVGLPFSCSRGSVVLDSRADFSN